ncbi:PREDICTED: putative F-box/kelch-repeat protein At2g29780 [Camelina sativa]|uniref:F-box/kelch-repeat protein At2g29780 n=1 Tax=Camelina sativa TaxID=90675 RepID=A0ABM1Q8R7_CAMSA|nr:PREDICTED: putative F-box/kelch-repeat protein At2g29780 [Camelina sativa]
MVVISELSGGSNGGDPYKNPQEEEEVNLAPIPPRQIPELLIARTVALVRRSHYPRLSLISRTFRCVISSPGLYQRRLQLGLTEPVLYASIRFPHVSYKPSWYILTCNVPRMIKITSLPPMNPGSSVVSIGYKMYVIGGWIGLDHPVSSAFVMDCRFHTCDYLPSMRRARYRAAAGVIDRKIYVIGGCEEKRNAYDGWIEAFDVDNGLWWTVPDPFPENSNLPGGEFLTSVVMQNRIYIMDALCVLVYEPRHGTWQSCVHGSSKLMNFWSNPSCVIEDLLYSICLFKHPIVVFDPVEMVWSPVKGLDGLPDLRYSVCEMANVGGKLMVLGTSNTTYNDIWCIEITLERREGGEIWGKVDSKATVLISATSPSINLCCSVTV